MRIIPTVIRSAVAALAAAALAVPAAPASARDAEVCKRIEQSIQHDLNAAGIDAAANKWTSAVENMQAVQMSTALYAVKDC